LKQKIRILAAIVLCVALFLPLSVQAESYSLKETDITLSIDDTAWYVFTRENLENNPALDELQISYESLKNTFYGNHIYMDAVLIYDTGEFVELFVRKKSDDAEVVNLSNYDDEEVLNLASELAKQSGSENYSIHKTDYKFAKAEYIDANYGYHICEFVTFVNKSGYTLTFQSSHPFSEDEYAEISKIVDSVKFNIDESLSEPTGGMDWGKIVKDSVSGAVIGGAIGGAVGVALKLIKKKNKKVDTDTSDEE